MSLSNTTVPKYYGEFREMVINGEIPVCETISLEMNRIDSLIDDPRYYYDDKKVEGWISFCESELTLTDGRPLKLLLTFKLWAEQVYGWYFFIERSVYRPYKDKPGGHYVKKTIKKRLINKQYLIVARGAAKTLYDTCHQSYGLIVDMDTTHQVTTAPVMKQAEEVLHPFRTAIVKSLGPVFKFMTDGGSTSSNSRSERVKLASTKKGIENFLTNSFLEVLPMAISKLQGLQNKYSTVDEWLSCEIREDPIGALEQGASKLEDYLIIATSSEGTIRNGVGDTMKLELMDILTGEYQAENVSIWWYKLDHIEEINNPDLWEKANPNIGRTVTHDVYQRDVERAEKAPAARNDILAKRFGIPMEGFTYFFPYEETLRHERIRSYLDMPCSLGIDLSQGDDFCAFTFMFPLKRGKFGIKVRSYVTERTMFKLSSAMRLKYEEFLEEGSLIVMDGSILNMDEVYEDLLHHIEQCGYEVMCVGYDPYNAKDFIARWERDYGTYGIVKIPQGAKTETVPLGELKKMSEDRILLFDEALMEFAMGNCVVAEDSNGNRKLYKKRKDEKIDNVSAMMDAYIAWKANPDAF